jgi:hypothetical protein
MKPTNYSARELVSIYDGLKAEKSTGENHMQDINDFVCPSFSDVTQINETPSRKKGQGLYTGIGQYCVNKLSKAIHAALTSTAAQWFDMKLTNDEIMKNKEIADWFAISSRIMFDYMIASNFPNEIMKTYKGLIGHGTIALNTDSSIDQRTGKFDKLTYETWATREFVFSEGSDELPIMVMRLHRLTPAKAMNKFGGHPRFNGLGKIAEDAFTNNEKKYKDKHEYLEVFYERTQYEEAKGNKKNWRHMPWGYCVVDYKDKKKVIQGGQMEQSTAIGRWEKNADDNGWGRSPSMDALPTIKTMNEIRMNGLKSLAKDLNPPLVISHRGVIGNLRTHAGGVIYKRKNADLDTLDSGTRYDAAQIHMAELAEEVKQHYMIDMIEMHPNESGTLGEFQIRHEQMMRLLGPTYGRLTYDIFNPTLFRTFNILLRNGKFPAMPQVLIDLAGNPKTRDYIKMDVQYSGPLARSQRSDEIQAIGMAYQDAAMIAQATGSLDAFDWLNIDDSMKLSLELRGVPTQAQNSEEDVEKARQARQAQMEQQQELEQRGAEAEVADKEADAAGKVVSINRGGQQ